MKKIFLSIILSLITLPAFCVTPYEDLLSPKDPAYRLGISDSPEILFVSTPAIQKEYVTKDKSEQHSPEELTYADLSIKRMSKEISTELAMEEKSGAEDFLKALQEDAT